MQSKYNALELRSKELIDQQGSAVSGASMALAGLGARLNQLVEQLISSYSISEQELEVSAIRIYVDVIESRPIIKSCTSNILCIVHVPNHLLHQKHISSSSTHHPIISHLNSYQSFP